MTGVYHFRYYIQEYDSIKWSLNEIKIVKKNEYSVSHENSTQGVGIVKNEYTNMLKPKY